MTAFEQKFNKESCFVTEGAPGLRLRREFGLQPDTNAALALAVRSERGKAALGKLWREDCGIASNFGLPFLAAAPARRPDSARAAAGGLGRELTAGNLDFMLIFIKTGIKKNVTKVISVPFATFRNDFIGLSRVNSLYRTSDPVFTSLSGETKESVPSAFSAIKIIPCDTMPFNGFGSKLTNTLT